MENKKPLDLTEIEVNFLRSHFVYKNNILANTATEDNHNVGDQNKSPNDELILAGKDPSIEEDSTGDIRKMETTSVITSQPALEEAPKIISKMNPGIFENSTGDNKVEAVLPIPKSPLPKAKPVTKIPLKATTMNASELTWDDAYKLIYDTRTRTRNLARRRQRKSSKNDIKTMKINKEDDAEIKRKVIQEEVFQPPEPEPIIIKPKMYNTPDSLTFEQACQKVMDCSQQRHDRYKKSIPKDSFQIQLVSQEGETLKVISENNCNQKDNFANNNPISSTQGGESMQTVANLDEIFTKLKLLSSNRPFTAPQFPVTKMKSKSKDKKAVKARVESNTCITKATQEEKMEQFVFKTPSSTQKKISKIPRPITSRYDAKVIDFFRKTRISKLTPIASRTPSRTRSGSCKRDDKPPWRT